MAEREPLDPRYFTRQDESPDPHFYDEPRFTVHIDENAIAAATAVYRELLPEDGIILDLMSSWRSHLPADVAFMEVVGLGLNAREMEDNPQLDTVVVHDLNADPALPFEAETFDGAVVTVSVQYMTRPVETFREVNRVLRSGAPFVLTYSKEYFRLLPDSGTE
jgi:SAM-dependent methyltransferase